MSNTDTTNISAANELAIIHRNAGMVDDKLSPLVEGLLIKHNEVKAGAVSIMLTLKEAYEKEDKDGNIISRISDFFPRPAENKEAEAHLGDNVHHEYFKAVKKIGGELKERNCNFFTEFWQETALGKTQLFIKEQLAHFGKGGDPTKAELKWQEMSADKRDNIGKRNASDMSRGRSWVRDAVGVDYVMADLEAYSERVTLEYDTDDSDNLSNSQYPFNLIDQKRLRNYRPMTVSDVLRLDVAMAVADAGENGSLYDALVKQLKRGKKTGSTESATFKDVDDCLNSLAQWNNYLDAGSKEGRGHAKLLKDILSKPASDEFVLAFGTFVTQVASNVWDHALETRYQRLLAKANKAAGMIEETEAKTGTHG